MLSRLTGGAATLPRVVWRRAVWRRHTRRHSQRVERVKGTHAQSSAGLPSTFGFFTPSKGYFTRPYYERISYLFGAGMAPPWMLERLQRSYVVLREINTVWVEM